MDFPIGPMLAITISMPVASSVDFKIGAIVASSKFMPESKFPLLLGTTLIHNISYDISYQLHSAFLDNSSSTS